MTDKEIIQKNQIINNIRDLDKIVRKHTGQKHYVSDEQFIRAYTMGFSDGTGIEFPCHWMPEVIREIQRAAAEVVRIQTP